MSRTHRSSQHIEDPAGPREWKPRRGELAGQTGNSPSGSTRDSRDKSVRIGRTRVGKGVFAGKRYPESAVIGEIEGDLIEDAHYGSRYCMDIGNGLILEPHAPFRFVNHSCEPNCEFDWFDLTPKDQSESQRHVFLIALREIKPDEELTIDYNWPADQAMACRCGAPTCRGWIVDAAELAKMNENATDESC